MVFTLEFAKLVEQLVFQVLDIVKKIKDLYKKVFRLYKKLEIGWVNLRISTFSSKKTMG